MKKYKIVFSPTGGSEKVATAIVKNWGDVEEIDLSNINLNYDEIVFDSEDLALIAMPSFGGIAPQLALDRLTKIKGNGCRCAVVTVYGNRAYEDSLIQMSDFANKAGFCTIAAISAVAEHSILHQYATNRPDSLDLEQLAKFGKQILTKASSKDVSLPNIPGNRPYKKAGVGMVPKAGKLCTGCGLCADKCPASAIDKNSLKITDKKKCISCMRCVEICPKDARKINGLMKTVAGIAIKKPCSIRKECELFI